MTSNDDQPSIEQAADDLLLLLARVESPDVAPPGPEDVAAVLTAYTAPAMPGISRRMNGNAIRGRDISFGFTAAADALTNASMGHLMLSLRLLVWTAHRTGLSHAEVVTEVLAQTDVERGI